MRRLALHLLVCLAALLAPARAAAQGEPLGDLKGVHLLGKADFPTLPLGYAAQVVAWSWRNPLTLASVERGLTYSTELPRRWTALEGFEAEDEILIQLNEPAEQPGGLWDLAMGYVPAPDPDAPEAERLELEAQRAQMLEIPSITSGPSAPWLIAGRIGGEGSPALLPLDAARDTIGTRWLRPASRIDKLPELKFELRCLLSWTDPARGVTRFALIETAGSQHGYLSELRDWLLAMSAPGEWFAVHSIGPQALMSTRGDWLAAAVDPRVTQRAGVVLRLRPAREGDLVDWARLSGTRLKASSFESGFGPERLTSGLLWPVRMRPAAWVSRPVVQARKPEPAWVELEFSRPRPIERITLVWPTFAGWTEHFLPQRATLTLVNDESRRDTESHDLTPSAEPAQRIERPGAGGFGGKQLAGLRLEFTTPSAMELYPRGRLAAIQLWAPWDGQTQAQPLP